MMTASQRLLKMSDMLRCNHIKACVDVFNEMLEKSIGNMDISTDVDIIWLKDLMDIAIARVKQANEGFNNGS